MSRTYFLQLPAWLELKEEIEKRKAQYTEEALSSFAQTAEMTLAKREFARGAAFALGMVLDLPNEILKDGDVNAPAEPPVEGTRITHEREQPRHPIRFNRPY